MATGRKSAPPKSGRAASSKKDMLRKGIKALGNIRDDVIHRQSRVFQAILGVQPEPSWSSLIHRNASSDGRSAELDSGRFNAVFDQRVAQALTHLDMPSPAALRKLVDEVAALRAELATLKAARRRR